MQIMKLNLENRKIILTLKTESDIYKLHSKLKHAK